MEGGSSDLVDATGVAHDEDESDAVDAFAKGFERLRLGGGGDEDEEEEEEDEAMKGFSDHDEGDGSSIRAFGAESDVDRTPIDIVLLAVGKKSSNFVGVRLPSDSSSSDCRGRDGGVLSDRFVGGGMGGIGGKLDT